MHDEAEVGADGQIRYGDQVRPRLLQEFQDLDKTDKLLANPAIEHQLGHHYPGQEMHESAVVENRVCSRFSTTADSCISCPG